jgi:hypothetical protein
VRFIAVLLFGAAFALLLFGAAFALLLLAPLLRCNREQRLLDR